MKKLLSIIILLSAVTAASAQTIDIVYPIEGHIMSAGGAAYLFGSVKPVSGKLKINGMPVKVHSNGAWIVFLPVKPGPFAFNCELTAGTQTFKAIRNIVVGSPFKKPEDSSLLYIDTSSLSPSADTIVRPGDWIYAAMSGSMGQKASFKIRGVAGEVPMPETAPGRYEGAYLVQSGDSADKTPLQLKLSGAQADVNAEAPGKITIKPDFNQVVEVTTDSVGVRTGYDDGYMLFLSAGQRLAATARVGRRLRVKLSETLSGWIDDTNVRMLPDGTPPPNNEMGTISTVFMGTYTQVSIDGTGYAPYKVTETENGLDITFFYTQNHTNWIVYSSSDTMLRDIRWQQNDTNTCTVRINFQPGVLFWGYDVSAIRNRTVVTLNRKPVLKTKPGRELTGLKVIVDPGHSPTSAPPYDGAIGPMRTMEYQHNIAIAMLLKTELEKHGASVITTRKSTETVSLRERPRIAMRENGHLYISIHGNALSDTTDPYAAPRGYSIYYYFPHSRVFGANVYKGLQKYISLPDEGIRYGDYHVVRLTGMPAILVETAYLILPEQEALLSSDEFRMKAVYACMHGIFSTFGLKYTPPPPPKKPVAKAKPSKAAVSKSTAAATMDKKVEAGKTKEKKAVEKTSPKERKEAAPAAKVSAPAKPAPAKKEDAAGKHTKKTADSKAEAKPAEIKAAKPAEQPRAADTKAENATNSTNIKPAEKQTASSDTAK